MDILEILAKVRASTFANPDSIKDIRKWYEQLKGDLSAYKVCQKMNMFWQQPEGRLLRLSNQIDLPFVKLMVFLFEQRAVFDIEDMLLKWRRLKAIGQQHLITYVRQKNLLERVYNKETITFETILGVCFQTKESLEGFNTAWKDDKSVDYRIRELLGCSMSADIRVEYKRWMVKNHPDRGGDTELCALVNATMEEWNECYI